MLFKFAAIFILFSTVGHAANEGKAAPELEATLFSGEPFALSKSKGQVVLINFWASWCEPCKAEMPMLDAYFKKHQKEGLQLLAITMDRREDVAKAKMVMQSFSFAAALGQDAKIKSYGRIWRLPLTFVIDRAGILRKDGWFEKPGLSEADLDKVVTPLLAAKP